MKKNVNLSKYKKFVDMFPTPPKIDYPHLSTILQQRCDVPNSINGGMNTPISLSSKFSQYPPGKLSNGFFYGRYSNPTVAVLNDVMAKLDQAKYAHSTETGISAFAAIMHLFKQGDEVILSNDTYTGTRKYLEKGCKRFGITNVQVDYSDLEQIEKSINSKTKAILLETPCNPSMKVYDMEEISKICKKHNLQFIVDNTTATQLSTMPLEFGADIVWYSTSKFVGGHGDAMGGCISTNNKEISDKLYDIIGTSFGPLSPFSSYLILRGLHTYKIRMQQHIQTSLICSHFLKQHPNIEEVYHTGHEDNPQIDIIKKQMKVPAAIFCFKVKGGKNEAQKFIESLKSLKFAESFGSPKTTLNYCSQQIYRFATEEEKQLEGITDTFFRLSPGLEEPEDLLQELDQALNSINNQKQQV